MAACCDGDGSDNDRSHSRRSRPSKRIDAARSFLKNISLDGKTVDGVAKWKTRELNGDCLLEGSTGPAHKDDLSSHEGTFRDDTRLITELPTNSKIQLHHSSSVACTNVFKESSEQSEMSLAHAALAQRSKSYIDTAVLGSSSKEKALNQTSQQGSNIRILDSKQFLTRNFKYMYGKRALLISAHGLPIGSFSVLPYRKEEKHAMLGKEKRTSYGANQTNSSAITIEGVEVGDAKKTVSYSHMLVPGLSRRRKLTTQTELDEPTHHQGRDHSGSIGEVPYHPFLLDDPELVSGKHRKVLNLKSYTVSVIQYAKPIEIKKDINERFKERFPNTNITLSKLRSVKLEMLDVGLMCGVDKATIASAHVYFEKLVFREKITKVNRKCCAGACLLLASKFNGDIKKGSFSPVIEIITDRFRLHLKDLLACELLVLIALKFQLCLPPGEVIPMYKRLESMRSIVKSRNRHAHRSQHGSWNHYRRDPR